MPSTKFEVRQSRKMIILACISSGIAELIFGGLLVAVIISLLTDKSKSYNDFSGCVFLLCFCGVLFIAFIIVIVYFILNYKYQVDVYTDDKMYRKKGERIIFELEYKNIISIRQGYDSIYLFCKEPIIKKNGKKGPRTLYEHYSCADIYQIKRIITDKFYNIPIQ